MQGKNLPGCIEEKNISLCFSANFSVMMTCCRLFWAYAMVPSKGFNFSNCKSFMSSFITSMPPKNHEWECKKKNNLLRAAGKVLPSWRSGVRFSNDPWKAALLICFRYPKRQITAEFQSLKHVLIEDVNGFMSPEKFRNVRETGCRTDLPLYACRSR